MAITRRNFLEVAGAAGVLGALAACDTKQEETPATADDGSASAPADAAEPTEEPADEAEEPSTGSGHELDEYPLDPDDDDVEKLYGEIETLGDGWSRVTNDNGIELGVYDTSKLIQVDGYIFRDMDGSGKLDIWEDWRLDADTRARALAETLTISQILPIQTNGGVNPTGALDDASKQYLNEGNRAQLSRNTPSPNNFLDVVESINKLQAYCESLNDWYGIPYLMGCDPYTANNNLAYNSLAPCFDLDRIKEAGKWMGKFYRNCGIRILMGPQLDPQTHPIWTRLSGAITEDPRYAADFTKKYVGGFQSTYDEDGNDLGWGRDSCAAMIKHYCGAGCSEGGRNDHNAWGKYSVFPGHAFHAHLVPFIDGGLHLDSVTEKAASVMPNYSVAFSADEEWGENVAGGYSKYKLDFLRDNDYDGMITTDWGEFGTGQPKTVWGVENLSIAERISKAFQAGVDQGGGEWNPEEFENGYKQMCDEIGEEEADKIIRESARRIFKVFILVDLFENPYTSRDEAEAIQKSEEMKNFGLECQDACVVMLKNKGNVICERSEKPKVYVSGDGGAYAEYFDVVNSAADCDFGVIFADAPRAGIMVEGYNKQTGEYQPISLQYSTYTAEHARKPSLAGDIWEEGSQYDMNPDTGREDRSYRGVTATVSNSGTLDTILNFKKELGDKPLVAAFACDNPFVFSEFEDQCDAILVRYGSDVKAAAAAKIIAGQVEPSALLTSCMPASMQAVEEHDEDVPRSIECHVDSEGNTYEFGFGMNWSGVIDDDRTATWKDVEAQMKPETIEI